MRDLFLKIKNDSENKRLRSLSFLWLRFNEEEIVDDTVQLKYYEYEKIFIFYSDRLMSLSKEVWFFGNFDIVLPLRYKDLRDKLSLSLYGEVGDQTYLYPKNLKTIDAKCRYISESRYFSIRHRFLHRHYACIDEYDNYASNIDVQRFAFASAWPKWPNN